MASPEVSTALAWRPTRIALLAALAVLILLPVLTAPHLVLLDAPAHEARLAVLRDLLITGRGSPFYELDTFFLPNIAFDLIGLGLTFFVTPEVAGRIFFGLTLLLTASGVALLNRVATGRWNPLALAAALLLYNLVTILGFFSYSFGLALVPWALAARLKLEAQAPAAGVAAGMLLSVVLLFCHVFDFGIYAVMSAGFALTALQQRRVRVTQFMARALEPVPAFVFFVMMQTGAGSQIKFAPLTAKLFGIAKSLTSGSIAGDLAFVVGGIGFALLLLRSRPRLMPCFIPGLAGLAILYFVLPEKMASGSYVDIRLPIAIALLGLAGLNAQLRPAKWTFALLAFVGMAFVAKQIAITALWRSLSPATDAIVGALDGLPAGAIILQTECQPDSRDVLNVYRSRQPAAQHIASLSNFNASRFIATLYAIRGQQPIRIRGPYIPYFQLQDAFYATCDISDYRARIARIQAQMQGELAAGRAVPPVYFLLLRPPAGTDLQGAAKPVSSGPIHALYEIPRPVR